MRAPEHILLSAWHGRRTSSCYGSAAMPLAAKLEELALRLPERPALAELRDLGFTTLVVHYPPSAKRAIPLLERLAFASKGRRSPLYLMHATETASAYAIADGAAH